MSLFGTNVPDSGRIYRFEPVIAPNLGASTKTATPAIVRTGQNIAYQLVIKNTGDAAAAGTTISDPIPAGASYVAGSVATQGSPAAVYNPGTNAVEWGAAPLGISQAVTVTFQVNVTAAQRQQRRQHGHLQRDERRRSDDKDHDHAGGRLRQRRILHAAPIR